ncbi:chemotaxis protein CheW [Massilia sp. MS-15]|uniref:chemotaxis protein CheW n=1 Tax=Massilia sp. MS-15 TaxID=2878200 RepID=UPI001CD64170|nr:chemotaxis protein CheW [Massilia sp. MS-15]MCA1244997.1 chemotaxis protein CheW [Massilia sp. MS-15]
MPNHLAARLQQFLGFTLGGLDYGLDYAAVQELRPYHMLERFSSDGELIGGVAHARGVIMPVVDLRAAFAPGPALPAPETEVIIVRVAAGLVGVVVERVTGVVRLGPQQVQPMPEADYLIGLGMLGARRMVLIDIERLMSVAPAAPRQVA